SLGLEPTRLLLASTVPVTPAVPLPQVTAPLLPFQFGLRTRSEERRVGKERGSKRPACSPIKRSPGLRPGTLLARGRAPLTPAVPSPQVTAPRPLVRPPFQYGLLAT